MIRNTTADMNDPLNAMLFLADAMGPGGSDRAIENQEKRAQQELVNSDRLPSDAKGTDEAFLALGFTLGAPDPADPIFRPATLPAGWKREASDHDMWSYIVDDLGRRRVSIFYKGAFYDRSSFMRINSVRTYVSECQYYERPILSDPAWATPAAIVEAATAEAEQASEYVAMYQEMGRAEDVSEQELRRDAYVAIVAQFSAEDPAK